MYTTPATTVGLASRAGAGLPLITGGCQCHTWWAEAAFDGVNAVALLTELCCGPCSYCGQSRFGAAVCACPAAAALADAPAAPAAGIRVRPAAIKAAVSVTPRRVIVALDIAGSFRVDSPRPRGWRRRTGIEPADDAARRPPVLKTGGATRHPDASGADPTVPPGRIVLRRPHWPLNHHPRDGSSPPSTRAAARSRHQRRWVRRAGRARGETHPWSRHPPSAGI